MCITKMVSGGVILQMVDGTSIKNDIAIVLYRERANDYIIPLG